jgi:hypothetical protein
MVIEGSPDPLENRFFFPSRERERERESGEKKLRFPSVHGGP